MRKIASLLLFTSALLRVSAQELVRVPSNPATDVGGVVTNLSAQTNMATGVARWLASTNSTFQVPLSAYSMGLWSNWNWGVSNFFATGFYSSSNPSNFLVSPTNAQTTGTVVMATSPTTSQWYPVGWLPTPTNAPQDNYVLSATGTNSKWAPSILTGNTNSGWITPYGSQLSPASQNTNYWLDFGLTNQWGPVTFQVIATSTNVNILGFTNLSTWLEVSLAVEATSGPVTVTVPTNWPLLNTNGLALSGTLWSLTLSNGSEMRFDAKTNPPTVSTMWTVTGNSSASQANSFYPRYSNPANYFVSPTNIPQDGYVVQATGGDSRWTANGQVGSGNNVWPAYSGSLSIFVTGGTASYGFDLSRAPAQKVQVNATAPSGTAIFYLQNFQETSAQYGVYYLTITCSGTNTQVSWLDPSSGGTPYRGTWLSQDGSVTNAPSLIRTNQAIVVTVRHFGGQTNYGASYVIGTNLDQTTPVFAN